MHITNRRSGFTLIEIMVAVAIFFLIGCLMYLNTVRSRERAQINNIVNNLRLTEGAKNQWAIDTKSGVGATPVAVDLARYMNGHVFPPPAVVGETYTINAVGIAPTAKTPVKLGMYGRNSTITIP